MSVVALFRLGKTADAVTTAGKAIPQRNRAKDDTGINPGIRDSATSSLEDARRF
jgi:hypothetical protein